MIVLAKKLISDEEIQHHSQLIKQKSEVLEVFAHQAAQEVADYLVKRMQSQQNSCNNIAQII